MRLSIAAAFFSIILSGTAGAQERLSVPLNEDYVQSASGMTFPPHVGAFDRGAVTRYQADGTDEGVGYNFVTVEPGVGVAATIYVSASPMVTNLGSPNDVVEVAEALLCGQQFDAVQAQIEGVHRGAAIVSEQAIARAHGGASLTGHAATYSFVAPNFFGRNNVEIRSEAYLFCHVGGRWSVKYRFTYPADLAEARGVIDAFMRQLAWTIPTESAP
jgi:hypothetical protein